MARKIIWVFFLLLLVGLFLKRLGEPRSQSETPTEGDKNLARPNLYTYSRPLDLNGDGEDENLIFKAYVNLPTYEITELFIDDASRPTLTIHGFYKDAFVHDVSDAHRVLEIQTSSGHSLNSLFYQYRNDQLTRISVSTEKLPYYEGVVSRNAPEFKDLDGDGVQEMLVYSRYFPPRPQRQVEVYKFVNSGFAKTTSFKEALSEMYY